MLYITTMDGYIKSYADMPCHKEIGNLIRQHSTNKQDIRDIVKSAADWDKTRTLLDLGCGYGWLEESLDKKLNFILGIDCLQENEAPFLKAAERIARRAGFIKLKLPAALPLESNHFDLVVAVYSFYFFPDVVTEVRRVLKKGGTFIAVTHSESMLEEGEHFFSFNNLRRVIRSFSAENGMTMLNRYFPEVKSVDYKNSLVFLTRDGGDLARYIDFKRGFIAQDADPDVVREKMLYELAKKGRLAFNKDDRIFIAQT